MPDTVYTRSPAGKLAFRVEITLSGYVDPAMGDQAAAARSAVTGDNIGFVAGAFCKGCKCAGEFIAGAHMPLQHSQSQGSGFLRRTGEYPAAHAVAETRSGRHVLPGVSQPLALLSAAQNFHAFFIQRGEDFAAVLLKEKMVKKLR